MFSSVKEAVYWSTALLQHRYEGGYARASVSLFTKAFEPMDVMLPFWRLVRTGVLTKKHEKILTDYGVDGVEPSKESQDHKFWVEALEALEPILKNKKILNS